MRQLSRVALIVLLVACTNADRAGQRVTLADGTVQVHYPRLPDLAEDTIVPDVRIGSMDGTEAETFGDIRGIEVDDKGRIYVLDQQAAEVRSFSPDGHYLATLTHRGDGPAEISRANGMVFDNRGTLWVQDYAKRAILGLSTDGEEVARVPMLVSGYGYLWNASINDRGVFWQTWEHSEERRVAEPEPGVQTGVYFRFYKSWDPATEVYDSIFLGDAQARTYVVRMANGWSVFGLPFAPGPLAAMDRVDRIWTGTSDTYRLARLDASGDTTLILQVDLEGPVVTPEEKTDWLESMNRYEGEAGRLKAELGALVPERKPVLERLVVDDENRLWVRRSVTAGELPLFDVFDGEGEYLGSVRMPADTWLTFPPVIRGGRMYFIVRDDFDVPYVVGAPLPVALRAGT